MTNLLRGAVQRGTAAQAGALDWPLGGKTGTTNDYTDAWFIGFDPTITVGVWVGFDEKKALGPAKTGAVAALPIWIDFMRRYIELEGDRANMPQFQAPGQHRLLGRRSDHRRAGAPRRVGCDYGGVHLRHAAATGVRSPLTRCQFVR